ncbi:MAG: NAD-binding protein [Anaerolineae bacterium]|nr:NAD-binding protein [Anaerolineae bacterium]
MTGKTNARQLRRIVRAYVRDTWVLIVQFRYTLLLFVALLSVGALALRYTYDPARPLRWGEALHTVLKLMFFETVGAYPAHWLAQLVYLAWPLLGIALTVNGVVQFGTALFNRQERKEAWQVAVASTYRNHVVVCGLGKVGYRVVLQLLKMEHEVIGIERDEEALFLERLYKEGIPILIGDVREQDTLEKAGVDAAAAVVVCTEDDLTNLEVALQARELNPTIKVVMRMFDQQLAERVRRGFGIQTAFSTSALAAPAFAAAATRARIEYSLYVDDVLLNVSRITVSAGSPLGGRTIEDVEQELDLSIVLHRGAAGVDFHPPPSLALAAGDEIVVFASLEALACLNRMNREEMEECQPEQSRPRGWLGLLRRKKTRPPAR